MTPAERARFEAWRRKVAEDAPPLSDAQIALLRPIWRPQQPAVTGNAATAPAAVTAPPDHDPERKTHDHSAA